MEKISRLYQAYHAYLESVEGDPFHDALMHSLLSDSVSSNSCQDKCTAVQFDREWIEVFENTLPFVEKAVEEQRRFIESFSEIRRVDQARKTSVESVRHLAEHSNLITHMDGPDIVPDKILIVQREDNYAIYENRFLFTLVDQMQSFLHVRYTAVQEAAGLRQLSLVMDREGKNGGIRLCGSLRLAVEQLPLKGDLFEDSPENLSDLERVELLVKRTDLLASAPLLRRLKGCTPVSSPVVRTNVFKNNENFRQALTLFDFLQEYRKPGYEIVTDQRKTVPFPEQLTRDFCELMTLQAMMSRLVLDPDLESGLAESLRLAREEERLAGEREAISHEQAARSLAAQARREEEAIRIREITLREEIIARKEEEMAQAQGEISDLRQELQTMADEKEQLNARLQESFSSLRSAEEALRISREETRHALTSFEDERLRRREDLEKAKEEVLRAFEQRDQMLKAQKAAEAAALKAQRAAEQAVLNTEREIRELKEKNATLQKELVQAQKKLKKNEEKQPSPHRNLKDTARKIWNA